jgi:hypothetical protein
MTLANPHAAGPALAVVHSTGRLKLGDFHFIAFCKGSA